MQDATVNLSGMPRSSLIGRILRLPLNLIPRRMVVPILQGPLRGKRWVVGSSVHGCWLGSYEFEKQRAFRREVGAGTTVYDLGANAGYYTLLAATLTGSEGHVYAFEPNPENLAVLNRHLTLNRLNNVTVFPVAVAESDGQARFTAGGNSSTGHLSQTGSMAVTTASLDRIVASGARPPQIIKIDVEGAEAMALRGAETTLSKYRPVVFLATHGRELHAECCRFLKRIGYSLEPLNGSAVETTDEIIAR